MNKEPHNLPVFEKSAADFEYVGAVVIPSVEAQGVYRLRGTEVEFPQELEEYTKGDLKKLHDILDHDYDRVINYGHRNKRWLEIKKQIEALEEEQSNIEEQVREDIRAEREALAASRNQVWTAIKDRDQHKGDVIDPEVASLIRCISNGIDWSGKLTQAWISDDKKYAIIRKGKGTCWSGRGSHKYAPIWYVVVSLEKYRAGGSALESVACAIDMTGVDFQYEEYGYKDHRFASRSYKKLLTHMIEQVTNPESNFHELNKPSIKERT